MRIIAGDYKGRKIFEPLDKETRPLKNLAKESIFNILEHSKNVGISIKKSNVLDLFSGTGSFGLECISRRASNVYFIEQRKSSVKILTKNIKKLNCEKKVKLFSKNVFDLKKIKKIRDNKFNLIFLDPPYKEKNIFELIDSIIKANILKKNGIIVIHRNKKSKDNYPNNFKILDIRKYGASKIIYGNLIF